MHRAFADGLMEVRRLPGVRGRGGAGLQRRTGCRGCWQAARTNVQAPAASDLSQPPCPCSAVWHDARQEEGGVSTPRQSPAARAVHEPFLRTALTAYDSSQTLARTRTTTPILLSAPPSAARFTQTKAACASEQCGSRGISAQQKRTGGRGPTAARTRPATRGRQGRREWHGAQMKYSGGAVVLPNFCFASRSLVTASTCTERQAVVGGRCADRKSVV